MKPFGYVRPPTLDRALSLLTHDVRPLAGGTDLLPLMKAGIESPRSLVDVKRLAELDARIESDSEGLTIGALATLADIAADAHVREAYPALAAAAGLAASPQLRNVATLGGNLLQQPRCSYFRSRQLECWRRGGEACFARDGENRTHAIFGDGPCHAVHPSDPACALLALEARVVLCGAHGRREVALQDFLAVPSDRRRGEAKLGEDELVVALRVPFASGPSVFLKTMERKAWAFALVSVAVAVRIGDGAVEDARIVLGGVAPVPWRRPGAERLLCRGAPAQAVAQAALERARPLEHNAYKIPLARALVLRALEQLQQG